MVVRKITPSSAELARYGLQHRLIPSEALALVGLAVLYNAVLAALDAAGIHQTYSSVAATELLILTLTGTYIVAAKVPVFDRLCVTLAFMGLGMALYVSFASRATAIDAARTCAIIGMFMILGAATTERQILVLFRIFSIVVLLFLIIEVVDTPLYVRIFQPAAYYSDTRGIEEFSLDDSGLFRNSLGFQGRFSFGLSSHRTASVFIEQVSLANFAGVLCLFLLACYERLGRKDRILHVATVLLILLTNDSRTSSIFAIVSLGGAYLFPRLHQRSTLLIMPAMLISGFALTEIMGQSRGDDFQGRVTTTITNLMSLDLGSYFGFGAQQLPGFMDSGYPYVIASSTVFGLVFLWLFLASAIVADRPARRRFLFGLNIYICSNLMIGGTAVFSIKIAAPLWLLAGYMGYVRRPTSIMENTTMITEPAASSS